MYYAKMQIPILDAWHPISSLFANPLSNTDRPSLFAPY